MDVLSGVTLTPEDGLVALHNSFCEVIHGAKWEHMSVSEGSGQVKTEDPFKDFLLG